MPVVWPFIGTGVELDRRPGMVFDIVLKAAIARAMASADEAEKLLEGGFLGPAYVWAVRSVELFVKQVLLLPLFLEEAPDVPHEEWGAAFSKALRKMEKTFGSDHWEKAIAIVNEVYGPLDPMHTEDGANIWDVWRTFVVRRRGDIVHAKTDMQELEAHEVATVIVRARQMMGQLNMRMIAAGKHPLSDLFVAAMENAAVQYRAESTRPDDGGK